MNAPEYVRRHLADFENFSAFVTDVVSVVDSTP